MSFTGKHFVGGDWVTDNPSFDAINPSTEGKIGTFPTATAEIIDEAVAFAQETFLSWRSVSRVQRADLFDNLAQLIKRDHNKLRDAISLETGKNLNESHAEVIEALHMCQVVASFGRQPFGEAIASELSTKEAVVTRKPKGVVAVISPWNFPLAIGSFWCSAPALLEGNTVVHKPSELTPMIAQMAAELYAEAGFKGAYSLIHGSTETGKALVKSDVDCILFTGSAEVGMEIRKHCASTWHKTCSCEMGSKSAVMIFEDGDADLALDVSVASAFKLSGQRCVSSGRLLIQRSVFDEFCRRFVERVAEVTTGDPFTDPAPFYGPLISAAQRDRVREFNNLVNMDSDCEVLMWANEGVKELHPDKGYFVRPQVYKCEWADKPFLKNEVFGPHVALIPFDDTADAIRIYNDTDYGLALGVVTDDFRKHRRLRDECNTGMLYINGGSIAAESHLVFGGVGKSGNGWKSAAGTYQAVTEEIAVTTNFEQGISWAQGMK